MSATAFAQKTPPASLQLPERPIPYPVPESRGFAHWVDRGTRTRTGTPGPNYWQQYARYTIDAELQPSSNQLSAHGTIRYYNRSPDTLRALWLHLNQNLFAPNAIRNVEVPVTGGTELLRVEAGGSTLSRAATRRSGRAQVVARRHRRRLSRRPDAPARDASAAAAAGRLD